MSSTWRFVIILLVLAFLDSSSSHSNLGFCQKQDGEQDDWVRMNKLSKKCCDYGGGGCSADGEHECECPSDFPKCFSSLCTTSNGQTKIEDNYCAKDSFIVCETVQGSNGDSCNLGISSEAESTKMIDGTPETLIQRCFDFNDYENQKNSTRGIVPNPKDVCACPYPHACSVDGTYCIDDRWGMGPLPGCVQVIVGGPSVPHKFEHFKDRFAAPETATNPWYKLAQINARCKITSAACDPVIWIRFIYSRCIG